MRAAIYAQFSSDLQDERSIIDQVALARKYAETRGLIATDVYQDAAISGASTVNRPDQPHPGDTDRTSRSG
jgi:site-specific DNA recombinase